MELRPRMLKDCLLEDSNSCSSNGFKSVPRRSPFASFPMIPKTKRKQFNALQAVINVVKNLRSNAIKSAPSGILPRSLSQRPSSKNKAESQAKITIFRVKDIVRWNSSTDLHEDIPYLYPSPPHQYTTKIMTTNTGSSTSTGTSCSSWCDSDFTSEFLPSSWGVNAEKCIEKESGENNLQCVGEDSCTSITDTEVGPEEDLQYENSPVSVFEIQDDEEASDSSFNQSLDNVERTKQKLMQTIQRFETIANISPFNFDEWNSTDEETDTVEIYDKEADEVEEKAVQLWNRVKQRHATWIHEEHLIMDYFRDELTQRTNSSNDQQQFEEQLVSEAKGWLHGHKVSEVESGSCVIEIEKHMKEERDDVALQIEDGIFSLLMNETLNLLNKATM